MNSIIVVVVGEYYDSTYRPFFVSRTTKIARNTLRERGFTLRFKNNRWIWENDKRFLWAKIIKAEAILE